MTAQAANIAYFYAGATYDEVWTMFTKFAIDYAATRSNLYISVVAHLKLAGSSSEVK